MFSCSFSVFLEILARVWLYSRQSGVNLCYNNSTSDNNAYISIAGGISRVCSERLFSCGGLGAASVCVCVGRPARWSVLPPPSQPAHGNGLAQPVLLLSRRCVSLSLTHTYIPSVCVCCRARQSRSLADAEFAVRSQSLVELSCSSSSRIAGVRQARRQPTVLIRGVMPAASNVVVQLLCLV
ncbi:hypothetical protein LSTR_LSTR012329 [Laodelphax striatellus]|uniref:Secreted protein n=1 Tax=Laodelphax striatellus TaxID=195883 RepID=A0A482WUE2_LAOST|nr:hypothetical protein LSTR_LSTR012329 [Laodelphax striatellus]